MSSSSNSRNPTFNYYNACSEFKSQRRSIFGFVNNYISSHDSDNYIELMKILFVSRILFFSIMSNARFGDQVLRFGWRCRRHESRG